MAALVQPRDFCRHLLEALEASEGQTRRRKRDQTPDRIGLGIRRDLLERAVAEAPPADEFEAWLTRQALTARAAGPVRAMGVMILDEFRFAQAEPAFAEWLAAGAPSDDASRPPDGPRRRRDNGDLLLDEDACPICRVPHLRGL